MPWATLWRFQAELWAFIDALNFRMFRLSFTVLTFYPLTEICLHTSFTWNQHLVQKDKYVKIWRIYKAVILWYANFFDKNDKNLNVFFWTKRKNTVLTRCPCFFFLTGLQHIMKCLGLLQRNSKQAKRFPLSDPVSLSQGRRHSGDSCVRQSCCIGDNAQQELWNVPWSLSETFYQHALLISNMCT